MNNINTKTPKKQQDNNQNKSSTPKKSFELKANSIYYSKPNTTKTLIAQLLQLSPSDPPKHILHNISLVAKPAQLLAIVGPSGAGKSTLIDILAARTSPTSGEILLNSTSIKPPTFRRISAHLPQHDDALLTQQLTVVESFAFYASLLNVADANAVIPSLLSDLRLTHIANSKLSGKLSGGERRRVSIGLSLLRDPAVLLLDEPTSGLDSSSAYVVMQSLKSVSETRGTTVILSIHQPSLRILSVIDNLLVVCKGCVVHHGSLSSLHDLIVESGFSVPSQLNPLDFAMEIISQMFSLKQKKEENVEIVSCDKNDSEKDEEDDNKLQATHYQIKYSISRCREIATLYGRCWKLVYRTKQLLLANTIEALAVGLTLGSIYIHLGFDDESNRKRLGLFAFTLTFLLSSTTESLPIFVNERPIVIREASSGLYRLSSHLIASTLVFTPYLLAIALLYTATVYFLAGLCSTSASLANFVLIIWSVLLTANSFVLFISSLAPDYIAGTSLVTVSLAAFFLFSGYFISKQSMPAYWVFVHYMSPYKYGLDALLANEYNCLSRRCFESSNDGECSTTGIDVLENRGLRAEERWENLQVLFGLFLFYRLIYWVVLSRRVARSNK